MDGLTPKQKAFADNYIISGNAAESAKKAGYSEKTARFMGAQNLTKLNILEYIKQRTEPTEKKRIASGDEVLQFFTRVMNGEEKDAFGLDASLDTKIKAAIELAKRTCDIQDKTETEEKEVVRIELTRNGKPV